MWEVGHGDWTLIATEPDTSVPASLRWGIKISFPECFSAPASEKQCRNYVKNSTNGRQTYVQNVKKVQSKGMSVIYLE